MQRKSVKLGLHSLATLGAEATAAKAPATPAVEALHLANGGAVACPRAYITLNRWLWDLFN